MRGPPGLQGMPGRDGVDGRPGMDGPMGHPGRDGPQGKDGHPGSSGSSGPPGVNGLPGHRGEKGFKGQKGEHGQGGLFVCFLLRNDHIVHNWKISSYRQVFNLTVWACVSRSERDLRDLRPCTATHSRPLYQEAITQSVQLPY